MKRMIRLYPKVNAPVLGLDVHKKLTVFCLLDAAGDIAREGQVATEPLNRRSRFCNGGSCGPLGRCGGSHSGRIASSDPGMDISHQHPEQAAGVVASDVGVQVLPDPLDGIVVG